MKMILDRIQGEGVARILVIRRRALGDALVNLPAIGALQRQFPEAEIDLLIDAPFAAAIGALVPDVNIVSWPPSSDTPFRPAALWTAGRAYDLVVDFLSTPATAVMTALSGARWRIGYDLKWRRWAYNIRIPRNRLQDAALRQFAGESFLDPLRALGVAVSPWGPVDDRSGATDRSPLAIEAWWRDLHLEGARTVSVVLSATWSAKAWPLGEAGEMTRRLRQADLTPILIPGPGEAEMAESLRSLDPQLLIAPRTDLGELAYLLRMASVHVGTDNGARHLAAALGTATVTIFGPTDPAGWNPEDPGHVSVGLDLDCMPCELKDCPLDGHPCMTGLSGSRVAETVIDLWRIRKESG